MPSELNISAEVVAHVLKQAEADCAYDSSRHSVTSYKLVHCTTNFCEVKKLSVDIQSSDGEEKHTLRFIVKNSPVEVDHHEPYRTRAFKKEALFYSVLAPLLNEKLRERGAPSLRIPKFYYHNCDLSSKDGIVPSEPQVIIFEDLGERGFESTRNWAVDEKHAQMVIKEMSLLHTAGLLLQKDSLLLLEEYPLIRETFMMEGYCKGLETLFTKGTAAMASLVANKPHLAPLREWLLQMVDKSFAFVTREVAPKAPFSVLSHADLQSNNFMVRYCKTTGEPLEIMLIDFQVIRVMPLMVDINYFTHLSLAPAKRKEIEASLLDTYHCTMKEILGDSTPITRETLAAEIKGNDTGLFYGILMLPFAIEFVEGLEDDSLNTGGRVNQMVEVIKGLAEEANERKVHERYADIEKFLWKF